MSKSERCNVPPEGWTCSRPKGHEGPCAASPSSMTTFLCPKCKTNLRVPAAWLTEGIKGWQCPECHADLPLPETSDTVPPVRPRETLVPSLSEGYRAAVVEEVDRILAEKLAPVLERLEKVRDFVSNVDRACDLIYANPHLWSTRPCPICRAVSILLLNSFGCWRMAEEKTREKMEEIASLAREARKKHPFGRPPDMLHPGDGAGEKDHVVGSPTIGPVAMETCRGCGKSGSSLDEFLSPYNGLCKECNREGSAEAEKKD